ncbi:hypothetical protein HF086_017046 [Spodoptera exigua]|uniref:Uncharacterized protein n=1 Tax=Spodoptera exigua TaxID=7107 RepID=A0A922M9J2_SPOEX|nr:hypothetical protein HF086_017046 [Spodoptera exigua]
MFKTENPQSVVKKSYFRAIFNRDFNLGFGNPRTDVCSKCIELDGKIKTENDQKYEKKKDLMIEKRVHKLRAKAFFRLLQEKSEDMTTCSFDCQKNNPLPYLTKAHTTVAKYISTILRLFRVILKIT